MEIQANSGSGSFSVAAASYNAQPGETVFRALSLTLNQPVSGSQNSASFYNFSIASAGNYIVNLSTSSSYPFYIDVYDNSGQLLGFMTSDTSNPASEYGVVFLEQGNYYVKIGDYFEPSTFNLALYTYTIHPGEDLQHAITLSLGTAYTGSVPITKYFNFSITKTGYYLCNLNSFGSSFDFILYTSTGTNIGNSEGYNYNGQLPINLTIGQYFLYVFSYGGFTGQFNVTVSPYAIHPGEVLATGNILSLNTTTSGSTPFNYFYNVTITKSQYYYFNLTYSSSSLYYMVLFSSSGLGLSGSLTNVYTASIAFNLTAGNYYVELLDVFGSGTFDLTVNPYVIHQGEDMIHAITLPINTTTTGLLPYNNYYNFTITNQGNYNINLTYSSSISPVYDLYRGDGTIIMNLVSGAETFVLSKGNYYIVVTSESGLGSFNLTLELFPSIPGQNRENAIDLTSGIPVKGSVAVNQKIWYNFTISVSGDYFIELDSSSTGSILNFDVYSEAGFMFSGIAGFTYPLELNFTLPVGTYSIAVYSTYNSGNYNLTYNLVSNTYQPPSSQIYYSSVPGSSSNTTSSSVTLSKTTPTSKTNTTPFSSAEIIILSLLVLSGWCLFRKRLIK